MNRITGLFVVFCALALAAGIARAEPVSATGRLEAFRDAIHAHMVASADTTDISDRSLPAFVEEKHVELFGEALHDRELAGTSDKDLEAIYQAASTAEFYTASGIHLRQMARYLDELETRDIASDEDLSDFYRALIHGRHFSRAREFQARHAGADLAALPPYHEAPGIGKSDATVLAVEGDALLRKPVALDAAIIVVSHPLCHFSQDAVRAIQSDAALARIFSDALWLSPATGRLNFDVFREWNREHPDQRMVTAFRVSDWPMIDYWGTPTFYFFRDGERVAKVVGWPEEGRMSELRAALREAGFLPAR